jgi:hypothetical protein
MQIQADCKSGEEVPMVQHLKASPTGEKASTMCRLALVRSTKKFQRSAEDSAGQLAFTAAGLTASVMAARSSYGNKFGTSPVFRSVLRSSTKASCLICESLKRNIVGLPSAPALHSMRPLLILHLTICQSNNKCVCGEDGICWYKVATVEKKQVSTI